MNPQEYSDEDVLAALKYVSGKTLQKTPVLNQERGASLFANAWRNGTATVFDNGMNLFTRCFGSQSTGRWYPLINAVYYEEHAPQDRDYTVNSVHCLQ